MKMYLVVVRTNLDELPIFLTGSYAKAKLALFNCTDEEIERAREVMKVDESGISCKAIVTFLDGVPQDIEIFSELESTDAVAAPKSSKAAKPRSRRAAKS